MRRFVLPGELVAEMCARLGVGVPVDVTGIVTLYERWKALVPFDPIAKALAMAEGRPPPGADPIEFCERWLATGVGGTCWGHVAGLAGILGAAGIRTRVALDRMLSDNIDFHAFLVVELSGADRTGSTGSTGSGGLDGSGGSGGPTLLALDPIHATSVPLALEAGAAGGQGTYRCGFEADDGRLLHWFVNPDRVDHPARYVVLSTDLDVDDVRAFCAISARFTGVAAGRLFFRRFPPGAFVQGRPDAGADGAFVLTTWTEGGSTSVRLTAADHLQESLGYNEAGVTLAERAGLVRVTPSGLEFPMTGTGSGTATGSGTTDASP